MRRFVISGYFEAEDIDDAFRRLAENFAALAEERDTESVLGICSISIEPDDAS